MVKSETCWHAEILVRNPSLRLFGKKFQDSKKVKTNYAKTRLRHLSKTLLRFRDPAKIFRDPRFSRYHLQPLVFKIRFVLITQTYVLIDMYKCNMHTVTQGINTAWFKKKNFICKTCHLYVLELNVHQEPIKEVFKIYKNTPPVLIFSTMVTLVKSRRERWERSCW